MKRSLVFPSPALAITDEKVGKVGYYDMLSSNYDNNCTQALLKVASNINMKEIAKIIDDTPLITEVRKQFYKTILNLRKELIIDRAFVRCAYHEYDKDALNRLTTGHQFSEADLALFIKCRTNAEHMFVENEKAIDYSKGLDHIQKCIFDRTEKPIDTKSLLRQQKELVEEYGFHSETVLQNAICLCSQKQKDEVAL